MNNLFNFNVYAPMLVGKAPKDLDKYFKTHAVLGSIKKDGYWSQLIKENNEVFLFSRSVSKKNNFYVNNISNVPHIYHWALENLPNGTCLIGEIYFPGKTSKDVTKIMGCLPEKAIQRQREKGNIHFYIHDLLKWNGEDYVLNKQPYGIRYSNLCKNLDLKPYDIPNFIEIAGVIDNAYVDCESWAKRIIQSGEEGVVFRDEKGLYFPGKRKPSIMFKLKKAKDNLDFVIMGFIDPNKEYNGTELDSWNYWIDGQPVTKPYYKHWKVGFVVGAYDNEGKLVEVGRVTSGLTDDMCADIAANPDKYLGNVIEIEVMSVDKERLTFRHPFFVRTHFDKPASDCLLSDIFE